jgi:hypothetical protein
MSKTGLQALLTPMDSVLLLIDHQPFQFANLHSHEPTMVVNNVIGLAVKQCNRKSLQCLRAFLRGIFDIPTGWRYLGRTWVCRTRAQWVMVCLSYG